VQAQSPETSKAVQERRRAAQSRITGLFLAALLAQRRARRARRQTDSLEYLRGVITDPHLRLHRGKLEGDRCLKRLQASGEQGSLPFLVFHPFGTGRLTWDVYIVLLLLYSMLTVVCPPLRRIRLPARPRTPAGG
jgi:hypothetical protein